YDSSGRIVTASRTGSPTVKRTFDGPLWTGDSWGEGRSVALSYDDNFWVTSLTVNGALTSHFEHDDDGLLTQASVLTNQLELTRDSETGLITDSQIADVTTHLDYNEYGEQTFVGASSLGLSFIQELERDAL